LSFPDACLVALNKKIGVAWITGMSSERRRPDAVIDQYIQDGDRLLLDLKDG
jgi:hypothetical protein